MKPYVEIEGRRGLESVFHGAPDANGIMLVSTEHMAELLDVQIAATNSGINDGIRHTEESFGGVRLTSSTITADDFGTVASLNGPIFIENS